MHLHQRDIIFRNFWRISRSRCYVRPALPACAGVFHSPRVAFVRCLRRGGLEAREKLRGVFRIASTCGPRLISGDECHFLNSPCFPPLSPSPLKKSFSSIIAPAPCAPRRRIIYIQIYNFGSTRKISWLHGVSQKPRQSGTISRLCVIRFFSRKILVSHRTRL